MYGVSGRVKNPGCWELPMGTPIREIIEGCAGGMEDGYQLRGFLPGGGSTDFLTTEHLDLAMDYDTIGKAGSRLGTGTMIILDDKTCPVGFVKNLVEFFAQESCGFCTPCRVGGSLLKDLVDKLVNGHATQYDVTEMKQIGALMKRTSHCGLGSTAPNPVLDLLNRFPQLVEERLAHSGYEPSFDLDAALQEARDITGRNDAGAHIGSDS